MLISSVAPRTLWNIKLYKSAYDMLLDIPLWEQNASNIVTNEGKDALNNVMFHSGTQITQWKIAIFNTNTSTTAAMTYAVPLYTESSGYDEAVRPAFTPAASSSQHVTNTANRAAFTMNVGTTIYGCSLLGGGSAAATKGDVGGGGTLYAVVLFDTPSVVVATNILSVGMTVIQA
jgi:hypothetical protein